MLNKKGYPGKLISINVCDFSYFINHYTKATTWEDPRVRYQQIGKPVSSAASTSSKDTTRHGAASNDGASTSDGAQVRHRHLN